ncbi:uncharacterized protein LOC129720790 [Wyeomyia smithii]|uniref:uncharacterized protein LOC129720790 n=1 Tax=Wyeomyia smithii TaxID=174621 RepID=UPI00246812A2|nr:uncharacterized protein LOC129720790 [Wyeomyia smithii]
MTKIYTDQTFIATATSSLPVIQLPTLPGQNTIQNLLEMNQQVDSADLETVTKEDTPQSSSNRMSDSNAKVLYAAPVQMVLHEVNPDAMPIELLVSPSNGFFSSL